MPPKFRRAGMPPERLESMAVLAAQSVPIAFFAPPLAVPFALAAAEDF